MAMPHANLLASPRSFAHPAVVSAGRWREGLTVRTPHQPDSANRPIGRGFVTKTVLPDTVRKAQRERPQRVASEGVAMSEKYVKDQEAIARLTPHQYSVTQESATEPAFRNEFWDHHEAGLYVDIVSGEPLFTSTKKFDSACGWPSFTAPVNAENVVEHKDRTFGMTRIEVRSSNGDSHLGHVFDDGPKDEGGLRYCINSAALRFISYNELDTSGYGDYKHLFDNAIPKEEESQ